MKGKWVIAVVLIAILFFVSFVMAGIIGLFLGAGARGQGNVAVIAVKGEIISEGASGFGSAAASAKETIKFIEEAAADPGIKAIIIDINSGGGSGVAADEISRAIKRANKTTVAVIGEIGTSAAYWVASATERIFANRMSMTGSIGVIASYLEISGLLQDYNVTYQRLVSGKYKDIGTPFRRLTPEEERMLQSKIEMMRDIFIEEVAKNRGLNRSDIDNNAMIYLGIEAKEIGLVDEIGGIEEAKKYLEKKLNITAELAEFGKRTFFSMLTEASNERSFFIGKGIGSAIMDSGTNWLRVSG